MLMLALQRAPAQPSIAAAPRTDLLREKQPAPRACSIPTHPVQIRATREASLAAWSTRSPPGPPCFCAHSKLRLAPRAIAPRPNLAMQRHARSVQAEMSSSVIASFAVLVPDDLRRQDPLC